jgi:hypothetical protein
MSLEAHSSIVYPDTVSARFDAFSMLYDTMQSEQIICISGCRKSRNPSLGYTLESGFEFSAQGLSIEVPLKMTPTLSSITCMWESMRAVRHRKRKITFVQQTYNFDFFYVLCFDEIFSISKKSKKKSRDIELLV